MMRPALFFLAFSYGSEAFQSRLFPVAGSFYSGLAMRPRNPVPGAYSKPLFQSIDTTASESPPEEDSSAGGGTATIPQEIFNLVKGIVGAGVLALPAGIAAFANAPSAVYPAIFLIGAIGALSGYGFALIGRVCATTGTQSFREAWDKSISEKTSYIPALSVTLMTVFAVLAYSMILGDTFYSLALTAGFKTNKIALLSGLTSLVLLPLCLLKDLSSLAPFSLLGSLGMIYTALAMSVRYLGTGYTPKVGKFIADVPASLHPSFGSTGAVGALSSSVTILLGMLSTSYMAHFNAPKFYTELKNNTIPRYLKVVGVSFGVSIAIFCSIAAAGFLTFGANSSGLILNNYSTRDVLMGVSRIAVALSLVFSYPLAFLGARDGVLDLFQIKNRSAKFLNTLTVGLLSGITCLAAIIPDVSFVLAFSGATIGNALIYIFPALMFRGAVKKLPDATRSQKREVKFALASAAFGVVMGIMGAFKALQTIF